MRSNMASSANIGRNGVSLSPIRTDTCIEDPLIGTYNAEAPLKVGRGRHPPTKTTACCAILSRIHCAVAATVRYGLDSKQVKMRHFKPPNLRLIPKFICISVREIVCGSVRQAPLAHRQHGR